MLVTMMREEDERRERGSNDESSIYAQVHKFGEFTKKKVINITNIVHI